MLASTCDRPALVRRLLPHLVALLAAFPALGWVVALNGFPLLYPDSAGYLREMELPYRSPFYGPFLHLVGGRNASVAMVLAHISIVAWCIWATVRAIGPRRPLRVHLMTLVVLGAASTLPWFTALLMPDAVTGTLPLLAFLLTRAHTRSSNAEVAVLIIVATTVALFHSSHQPLYAALAALAVWGALRRESWRGSRRVAAVGFTPTILAATISLAANHILFHRTAILPASNAFALARLLADGSARRYLTEACPVERYAVCPHLDELTNDSNALLWRVGPFRDGRYLGAGDDEAGKIVVATLRTRPGEVVIASLGNAARLLARTGVDDIAGPMMAVRGRESAVAFFSPPEMAGYRRSRQSHGTLQATYPTTVVSVVGVLSLVAILVRLRRRRRDGLQTLIHLGLAAIVINAGLAATVSGVESRYEARMLWVLPLLATCCVTDRPWRSAGEATGAEAP